MDGMTVEDVGELTNDFGLSEYAAALTKHLRPAVDLNI